jgi:type I restriction enzyme, S subunit
MSPDALSVAEPGDDAVATTGLWELPTGWAWAPASSFATVVGGGTPRDAADPANYAAEGIPWLTPADLSGYTRSHIDRGARSLSQRGFENSSARFLPAGTVLFSSRAPVGYCVVASNPICTNQGFKSLVLRSEIVPEYIRYYMLFNRKYFVYNASGTTFKELSGSVLADLLFPIAPTRQQRRIVARIDELFAEIGEGETALQRARQGLDTWRRALLKAAVTGELTRDWREANRPPDTGIDLLVRIRAEGGRFRPRKGRVYRKSASEALNTNSLPELPEGWVWARIGEIVSDTLIGLDRNAAAQREGSDGTPYIKMNNISMDGVVDTKGLVRTCVNAAETVRYKVLAGDVLFNTRNSRELVGKTGIVKDIAEDTVFNNNILRLRFPPGINHDFINFQICSPIFRRNLELVKRATRSVAAVYQADLLLLPIAITSTAEQAEIVSTLKLYTEKASNAADLVERTTHTDRVALRRSILKAAFEGRLVPQDPTDEPAPVLLSRLRNGYPSNGARRRRVRAAADASHPSLPGLSLQSVDPRVEPAGDD